MGIGLTPYHLLELIDGPGHFEFSKNGYRHVRHFIKGPGYALVFLNQRIIDGVSCSDLYLNGMGFRIVEMPDDRGRWVREDGGTIEFELPPHHAPSEMIMRIKDGKPGPWLSVYNGKKDET